ncbi:MAG: photosynthetic complex putative assembly protein PuhB [Pseudomonadota bacterium]
MPQDDARSPDLRVDAAADGPMSEAAVGGATARPAQRPREINRTGDNLDDYTVEPVLGLPETPPEGERILWQGAPDWRVLALGAFGVRWVAIYTAVICVWRAAAVGAEAGLTAGVLSAIPLAALGAVAMLLLAGVAYFQASTTVYTLTNRRVVMRIGAALTVTLNLPHRWIGSADLKKGPWGSGDLAFGLMGSTRLSYLVCWPHVRPWRLRKTEPALRAIPEVEKVAALFAEAAQTRIEEQALERGGPAAAMAAE